MQAVAEMGSKLPRERRHAARLLEPGPVVLVTAQFRSQPNVMTAAWVMPLSLDPPRVVVAIHPSRFTHELVTRGELFVLNLPTLRLLDAVHRCGIISGRDLDKFAHARLHLADALEIDVPVIEECVAHIECGLAERLSLGDHDLFVGEVVAVSADEELFTDRWQVSDEVPLIHHIAVDAYAGLSKPYHVTPASGRRSAC
jgi:flavin reductase (DIM6/NTAB) family NADH-FMN oxidoreductase RutF